MFHVTALDRLAGLLDPYAPRLVGAYLTPDGYALVFEWFDGERIAAVEPLGLMVGVPREAHTSGGRRPS